MPNMSYCRFRNTLNDLRDCYDNMEDLDEKSDEEKRSQKRLIKLCAQIAKEYGESGEED